jgi:urease accessory protein
MCCSSNDRDLPGIGRHGELRLVFREKDRRTILQESYATMPMHCLPPLYPDSTGWAYAYLVNPTGGFVGGDRIETDITLRERSHVFLTTQSATRIYRSTGSFATQQMNIDVKEGAAIEYLPGYIIPFTDSLYRQTTKVRMEKNTTAFLGDSFTTGRLAMGEHLAFGEYTGSVEIEYDGFPLVFDRLSLRPGDTDYTGFGLLESFCICSTIYLIFGDGEKEKALTESIRTAVDESEGVLGGVSSLWSHGIVIRLLGAAVRHIEKVTGKIWSIARKAIFPDLGETEGLAALHCRVAGFGNG